MCGFLSGRTKDIHRFPMVLWSESKKAVIIYFIYIIAAFFHSTGNNIISCEMKNIPAKT